MGDVVAEVLKLIGQIILWPAAFGTAYVVLPLASFGKVQALFYYPIGCRRYELIRRLSNGKILILGDATFVIGIVIWIVAGIAGCLVWQLI